MVYISGCHGISRDGLGHVGLGTRTWCNLGMSWEIPGLAKTCRTLLWYISRDVLGYPGMGLNM